MKLRWEWLRKTSKNTLIIWKKRHTEEAEYLEARKNRNAIYKEALIKCILKSSSNFTKDELIKKPLRILERIACY